MNPSSFVLASKLGTLQKLLEGDPQTITFLLITIPVTVGILFLAAKARRGINARRGRTLHGELAGSRLVEHASGALIFEVHHEHMGVQTVVCGLQTGRKSEQSLYSQEYVTFEEDTVYDQRDAEGFIKLNALRLRLANALRRN